MESFRWSAEFVTGIDEVDLQHRGLVELINGYGSALTANVLDREYLEQTLGKLGDYARNHFASEERLMELHQLVPEHCDHHREQHRRFVEEVGNLAATIEPGRRDDYRALLDFLIHWLAYHILGVDQRMAFQILAIESGTEPAAAHRQGGLEKGAASGPLLEALSGLFELVSRRNQALLELNRTLEAKVEERTAELLRTNRELELISITDHLTGLPNRRFAMRQLALHLGEALEGAGPLACLMIDADGFKSINDSYGHDAGDLVLRRLAKELKDSVRSDDLVCRLGGDEFLVVGPNTALEGALYLGEQIRAAVAALRVPAGGGCWYGSVSIGVAVTRPGLEDMDSLLKAADEAVYLAKKDGRNCVRTLAGRG